MSPDFSEEPREKEAYRNEFDRFYTRFAGLYSVLVTAIPIWRRWIGHALPHILGPKVLEVSFGTGHLLGLIAESHTVFGVDLNASMARLARGRLRRAARSAYLQVAAVEHIPYASDTFDSVVNTMSFSGNPDGARAMHEMRRVLKPGGRLVMVDVNFPRDGNWRGTLLAQGWKAAGDLIRDVPHLFHEVGWSCRDREVGGFSSVHLYLAEK